MTESIKGVRGKMARGAAWMVGFKLAERSIGLVSTAILARLLAPEDFGLIAMATAVIAVISMLQAFEFDMALIQNQQAEREDYDTAWTLNIVMATVCAALLAVAAHPMAVFYNDPRVESVIYWLVAGILVQGFENIGIVGFLKELTLHKEFWFLLTRKLVAFAITVLCALWMRNYWALVIGMVSSQVIGVALSYLVHPYRPTFSLARSATLFNFSKWFLITNALLIVRNRAADIIVGRIAGAHTVGLFSLSVEISNLPTTELSAPINRAAFPGYSILAGDADALREVFRKVLSLVVLLTVPAALGIALVAEPLVLTLLGAKWAATVPLIQVLTIWGLATSIQRNLDFVFFAKGRARFITILTATVCVLELPLVIFGALHGSALGAALGLLVSALIPLPFVLAALSRLIGLCWRDWFSITWRPVLATATMVSVMLVPVTSGANSPLVALASSVAMGAATYAVTIIGLWVLAGRPPGPETFVIERALTFLTRREEDRYAQK